MHIQRVFCTIAMVEFALAMERHFYFFSFYSQNIQRGRKRNLSGKHDTNAKLALALHVIEVACNNKRESGCHPLF